MQSLNLVNQWRLSPDLLFHSEQLGQDLAHKSISSGITSLLAQGVIFVLSTSGTIILARMLTPDDYGLVGMVAVVTGFAVLFRDAGLSTATVQQKIITSPQISTLFWLNVLISFALGLGVLASSSLLAEFYGRPELIGITSALSVSFILSGFVIQHQALLRRHMRFGVLAVIRVIAQIVTLIVAILLAWFGWGYWALIVSTLVTALVTMGLTFFFCPWKPERIQKGTGVRGMLSFGGYLTGANVVNHFSQNVDNILIGRFIGATALGLYSKAYSLFMLSIIQLKIPVNQVGISTLVLLRNQPERYIKYYQRLLDLVASLTIPIALYCAIEAEFLIRILLGTQWIEAIPVFRILAVAAVILPVANTCEIVMITHGYSARYFYWGIVNAILLTIAYLIGLSYGIVGVALAFTITNYLLFLPLLFYSFRQTPITVILFLNTIMMPLFIAALAGFVVILINYIDISDAVHIHIVNLLVFALIYIGLSWSRRSIREVRKIVWNILSIALTSKLRMQKVPDVMKKGDTFQQ